MLNYQTLLLYFTSLVCTTGGFAPSIEIPLLTPAPPPLTTTRVDSEMLPAFLGHYNVTVTVHSGDTATLACHVTRLNDNEVTWVRRQNGELHILTIGYAKFHNDNRYTLHFEKPNNWKLQIRSAQKADEGQYECQISTHPPTIMPVFLRVTVPEIKIRDPRGKDVEGAHYYRMDSTVGLKCEVKPVPPNRPVIWTRRGKPITTHRNRGIRVSTSAQGTGVTSWLHIARASLSDTANYTCTAGDNVTALVAVTVLDGESSAPLHHSTTGDAQTSSQISKFTIFITILAFIFH